MSQATNKNKPPLPLWIELLGWAFLIAMCASVLSSTGCRGVEYTASAAAAHDEGPQHYTARVEIKNNTWSLAN